MKKSKIFIVGVDHLIQYKNNIVPDYLYNEFAEFIQNIIRNYDIKTVAEEFNREYLDDVYFSPEAAVQSAALKSGVRHIFCDPGEKDRSRLGIPYFADIRDMVKEKYGIREKFIFDINMRKKIDQETISESKKYWEIREEYWFEILSKIYDGNILFVCGHEHALRFKDLLFRKGRGAEVMDLFWRSEIFSDYSNLGIS